MKLKQWLYGATALAMLAACSDKDIAPEIGGTPTEEGSGFIGVRIQLPTIPSTRANDSFEDGVATEYALSTATLVLFRCDVADVMTDDKYDAKKDVASKAKCIGAFELKRSKEQADLNTNKQITTQVIRFANVTGMEKNADLKLYALVMANGSKYGLNHSKIADKYAKSSTKPGYTIQQLQEEFTDQMLYTQEDGAGVGYASNIFMSSSPLSTYHGGETDPNDQLENEETEIPTVPVLVEIDKTPYPTEQEAIDHPAGTIHIERAVGKVTCSDFTSGTGDDVVSVKKDGITYTLEVEEVYWDLCQDMQNTYLVRNTNRVPVDETKQGTGKLWSWNYASNNLDGTTFTTPAGKYRMLGHTEIPVTTTLSGTATTTNYYRPYFCQVPGYSVAKEGDTKKNYEEKVFRNKKDAVDTESGLVYYMEPEDAVIWDKNSAFYPHENTFPVDYMKYANTTRIGFWVTFKFKDPDGNYLPMTEQVTDKDGKQVTKKIDFYTRGLDKSTIYTKNPLETMAGNYLKTNLPDLKTEVTAAMKDGKAGEYDKLDLSELIKFDWDDSDEGDGQVMITKVYFKYTSLEDMPSKYQNLFKRVPAYSFEGEGENKGSQLLATLNDLEHVYKYKEGKVFYEVRIKHFGDDLTPWNAPEKASTIEESYGTEDTRKNNYLGRYGIVRNNWYDLQVKKITKLGPPVDPAKWDDSWPGKPDDNKDEYIAVILRVLSWAKRTQSVIF